MENGPLFSTVSPGEKNVPPLNKFHLFERSNYRKKGKLEELL